MGALGVTRAFLFTDLRGFTQFLEEHGDAAASELLDRYRQLVRDAVAEYRGAEVKTEGDSFYVTFESPSDAVNCGVHIVREADGIPVAVGIDAGEALPSGDAYVGGAVNRAARLCAIASAGEVLVSETVRNLTHTHLRQEFAARGTRRLKGVAQPVPVYSVGEASRRVPRRFLWPGAAAILVLLVVLAAMSGQRLLANSGHQPTAKIAASPKPIGVPHGPLLYQAPMDVGGSGFQNIEALNQRSGSPALEFGAAGVAIAPRSGRSGTPALVAVDVKLPPVTSYVAALDVNVRGSFGNSTDARFDWVFSRGDGATTGDHSLAVRYSTIGVGYYAPGSIRNLDAQPDLLTVPTHVGHVGLPPGMHSLVVVVDPPRYVAYLDGQQLGDVCDKAPGHLPAAASGMTIVAVNDVASIAWNVQAIQLYSLQSGGTPPSIGCA